MMGRATQLRGSRILVLNWRDIRHPQAGGAEQYMHEIAARWLESGADVTWLTARAPDQPSRERIDGIRILRAGGELSVYARTALHLLRTREHFDAVVDCQNGVPFFAPLFAGADTPVVQVVHHVHQDQFATRFSAPMAALGRVLEGPVARRVYGDRAIAAVSPSTRTELRRRIGFRGPIFVVPNGTHRLPATDAFRSATPTIVVVSRLVPHKRIELLLGHLPAVVGQIPDLRVEVVGDGPERARLQGLSADLGLQSSVRFRGRVSQKVRDDLLARAWLTTSTSAAEGWGCTVVEAAAGGVPCLALRVPGIRDSVLDGETGWLVDRPADLGAALVDALVRLRDRSQAAAMTRACREWAACFTWERSADLLAGVVLEEMRVTAARRDGQEPNGRFARSDMAVLVDFQTPAATDVRDSLRSTDEVVQHGDRTSVILSGCDEFDAANVLQRIGVAGGSMRPVDRRMLLAGPASLAAIDDVPPAAPDEKTGVFMIGRSA
jgi:glycosyltransferase involved in cell wall biosynthesis